MALVQVDVQVLSMTREQITAQTADGRKLLIPRAGLPSEFLERLENSSVQVGGKGKLRISVPNTWFVPQK